MKQTNNAIKFLMAQYRAIFQNAYFKGLATAAVVTMGLAAGQAQAASALTITDEAGWKGITAGEHSGTVSLTSGAANDDVEFVLTLTGNQNKINATTASGTVSAKNGTLKLNSDGSKLAIGTDQSDKGTTLTVKAIDILDGIVEVKNTTGSGTVVNAGLITIGGKGELNIVAADENLKFGSGDTVYTLAEGAKVNLTKTTWEGDISNASGATIAVEDSSTHDFLIKNGQAKKADK